MKRKRPQINAGFTLIELLVVIAIIGILASAGTIGYQNYLTDVRAINAQNGLRSIYLMQRDFFLDNNAFFAGADIAAINVGLFDGENVIDPNGTYTFTIVVPGPTGDAGTTNTFRATATNPASGCEYFIDESNVLDEPDAQQGNPPARECPSIL